MNEFQILFANGISKNELDANKQSLELYDVNVAGVYVAHSKDDILKQLISNPDINVILVPSELHNQSITIDDVLSYKIRDDIIIIPVLGSKDKGNNDVIAPYIQAGLFNILFDDSCTMSEMAEVLLYSRTSQMASIYAGITKGKLKKHVRPKSQKKSLFSFVRKPDKHNNTKEGPLLEEVEKVIIPNRGTQSIFDKTSITLAFCGVDIDAGCTTAAISAASFIASSGNTVAVIEPNFTKDASLAKTVPGLSGNKVVTYKNIDFYPSWDLNEDIFTAHVVIFDFSKMFGPEHQYLKNMNKVFLCSSNDIMETNQLKVIQSEMNTSYQTLFKECSQTELMLLKQEFPSCYSISMVEDKFTECSVELKRLLQVTLLRHGLDFNNPKPKEGRMPKQERQNKEVPIEIPGEDSLIYSDRTEDEIKEESLLFENIAPALLEPTIPVPEYKSEHNTNSIPVPIPTPGSIPVPTPVPIPIPVPAPMPTPRVEGAVMGESDSDFGMIQKMTDDDVKKMSAREFRLPEPTRIVSRTDESEPKDIKPKRTNSQSLTPEADTKSVSSKATPAPPADKNIIVKEKLVVDEKQTEIPVSTSKQPLMTKYDDKSQKSEVNPDGKLHSSPPESTSLTNDQSRDIKVGEESTIRLDSDAAIPYVGKQQETSDTPSQEASVKYTENSGIANVTTPENFDTATPQKEEVNESIIESAASTVASAAKSMLGFFKAKSSDSKQKKLELQKHKAEELQLREEEQALNINNNIAVQSQKINSNSQDKQKITKSETKNKERSVKKKALSKQILCGKQTIFITGFKHGCGCSHLGLSFARFAIKTYADKLCLCHKRGAYELNDDSIYEYTKTTEYETVFGQNDFIIYDCGILGELNTEQMVELKRADIKILVCNGDDKSLGALANFIRQLGGSVNEWVFAFNLVTSKEKETYIKKIMSDYNICFIPLHEWETPPSKVTKLWDSILKRATL